MNGNTPDQAELREKLSDILAPKFVDEYGNIDFPRLIAETDKVIALFAQQPSSQAIERAKIEARIEEWTFYRGQFTHHEIWTPQELEKMLDKAWADFMEAKARLTEPDEKPIAHD